MMSPVKARLLIASLLGLACASTGFSASRFATVDMARVLRDWVEVKKVAAWLQKQKEEYQEVIDEKQTRVKRINEELQDPQIPNAKKEQLDRQKRQLLGELQDKFQELRVKLAEMEKREFDRLKDRIYEEIDRLVARRSLEMVFEKQWIYFPRNAVDITDELLQTLDRRTGPPPSGNRPPSGPRPHGN